VANGSLGLIVTPIVVAELAYVARSPMGWTHRHAAEGLEALLEAQGLIVLERDVQVRALRIYGERPKLDFADAYLAAKALELGPGVVASFDSDLDAVDGIKRLSA
jgi:predicted nucleic acid-binding protein